MTFRKRRERAVAIKREIQSARERLNVALQSMDYAFALACQIEIDNLKSQACRLERRHGLEPYPAPDEIG